MRVNTDRGSVLILMPAAVLVVMVLGGLAVDMSMLRAAHADLQAVVESAASDAVTVGLDVDAVRSGTPGHPLAPERVCAAVEVALGRAESAQYRITEVRVAVDPDSAAVAVLGKASVSPPFSRAISAVADTDISATGRAVASRDPRSTDLSVSNMSFHDFPVVLACSM